MEVLIMSVNLIGNNIVFTRNGIKSVSDLCVNDSILNSKNKFSTIKNIQKKDDIDIFFINNKDLGRIYTLLNNYVLLKSNKKRCVCELQDNDVFKLNYKCIKNKKKTSFINEYGIELNENLSYLIGYFFGRLSKYIECDEVSNKIYDDIKESLILLNNKDEFNIKIFNKYKDDLKELFLNNIFNKDIKIKIPNYIKENNEYIRASFINGVISSNDINLVNSIYEDFIIECRGLLLSLGYLTKYYIIYDDKTNLYNYILVNNELDNLYCNKYEFDRKDKTYLITLDDNNIYIIVDGILIYVE
jgi:hypothetical protein